MRLQELSPKPNNPDSSNKGRADIIGDEELLKSRGQKVKEDLFNKVEQRSEEYKEGGIGR